MIRILIAEDSEVVALLLKAIFEQEEDLQVVGHARNGAEAVTLAAELKPDLITMDIRMPVMDGFEATREIMSSEPVPIVVISSSVDDEELRITFRAIEEGALAVIEKPRGIGHPEFDSIRKELVSMVRAMAEVKLVRRRRWNQPIGTVVDTRQAPAARDGQCDVIAVGASTGGPQALRQLLSSLPANLAVPVAVVQHIGQGFLQGLVDWLDSHTALEVRLACDGDILEAGQVYFAPEERHLTVRRRGEHLTAVFTDDAPVSGVRPSATVLFQSVAAVCAQRGAGVLLSGMGNDGASGLLAIRRAGGRCLAQDEESCVVFGMPGSALALGAVERTTALERMAAVLTDIGGVVLEEASLL